MVRNMKTRSALSYFGSDSEVAKELASFFDHCKHVSVPFVGGASIIPHLSGKIVASDLNDAAINFYQVVKGMHGPEDQKALFDRCRDTLSHPSELAAAAKLIDSNVRSDRAWAYWAACWIPRKGNGGTKRQEVATRANKSKPSVRRTAGGGNNADRLVAVASDLTAWADHFKRCEFSTGCFREEMPKYADRLDNGVYIDAPWYLAGDRYLHKFEDVDHVDLEEQARRFKLATVVIRYGENDWIRDLYSGDHWKIELKGSRTQANVRKPELWISNTRG